MPLIPARSACATLVLLVALQAGCRRYEAFPMDAKAKASALASPDQARLQIQANDLRHPILNPMRVDFSDGLSPEEAAVSAVVANPDLRAVRDQRGLVAAQLFEAGLLPDPVLSFSQDVPTASSGQGLVTARTTQIGLDLTAILTHGLRRRVAQSQQRAVDLDVAWAEWQVAEAAKLSVHRIRALERLATLADETTNLLADNLRAVENSAAAGEAPIGDVAAARAALDAGQRSALALFQSRDHERQSLNALLGFPPDTQLLLEHEHSARTWSAIPAEKDLVAGLDRRLDLVALQQGYESQDVRLRLAVWSQFPSIGLSLGRASDTSGIVTHGYGVGISLPLFNRGRGAVAVEEATRQLLHDQYLARLFHARQDLTQIYMDLKALTRLRESAEGALPALASQSNACNRAFEKGNLDLGSRNQARLALLSQEGSVVGLQLSLDELLVALEIAAGRILPPELTSKEKH